MSATVRKHKAKAREDLQVAEAAFEMAEKELWRAAFGFTVAHAVLQGARAKMKEAKGK